MVKLKPILCPPDTKHWVIGKGPDAGKDWRQEEKGMTEDKMVGWHHRMDGHEFEQVPEVGGGQGILVCCSPWDCKIRHDWSEQDWCLSFFTAFALKSISSCLRYQCILSLHLSSYRNSVAQGRALLPQLSCHFFFHELSLFYPLTFGLCVFCSEVSLFFEAFSYFFLK